MPDSPQSSQIGLYRQLTYSPEHRQAVTVAREPVVADTLEHLRGSSSRRSKHHFLFIGPRGIGKTHFLSILLHRVDQQPALRKRVSRLVRRRPRCST